jgi:hypothetical protein
LKCRLKREAHRTKPIVVASCYIQQQSAVSVPPAPLRAIQDIAYCCNLTTEWSCLQAAEQYCRVPSGGFYLDCMQSCIRSRQGAETLLFKQTWSVQNSVHCSRLLGIDETVTNIGTTSTGIHFQHKKPTWFQELTKYQQ